MTSAFRPTKVGQPKPHQRAFVVDVGFVSSNHQKVFLFFQIHSAGRLDPTGQNRQNDKSHRSVSSVLSFCRRGGFPRPEDRQSRAGLPQAAIE